MKVKLKKKIIIESSLSFTSLYSPFVSLKTMYTKFNVLSNRQKLLSLLKKKKDYP